MNRKRWCVLAAVGVLVLVSAAALAQGASEGPEYPPFALVDEEMGVVFSMEEVDERWAQAAIKSCFDKNGVYWEYEDGIWTRDVKSDGPDDPLWQMAFPVTYTDEQGNLFVYDEGLGYWVDFMEGSARDE